jgi:tRNA nucleotidyltransferase (CCA-adding enzyme)
MAIRIDREGFGLLLDYFGGQRDILDKKIRVLHSLSFVDDPSRAFRALRFASRFGFTLGGQTERLMKHAERLGLYAKISGGRKFLELKYILSEERYVKTIELLKKYNMLGFIAEGLAVNDSRKDQFAFLEELYENHRDVLSASIEIWRPRFIIFMGDYNPDEVREILRKLNIEENIAIKLNFICTRARHTVRKFKQAKLQKPSEIYRALSKLDDEELLTAAVQLGRNKADIISSYLGHYKNIKPKLNGEDLKGMGIPASALMGSILNELMDACLDGIVTTREQEEEFVRNRYQSIQKEV